MAALDRLTFIGTFDALFADNTSNEISAADLRAFVLAISESFVNMVDDSEVFAFRGAFDASVNAYPSSGGTGPSGVIQAGNFWYVSVSGDLTLPGLGVVTLYPGAIIKALIDGPGTNENNWKVMQ